MKVLVFGATGDLGSEIVAACRERQWEVQELTRRDFDVGEVARTQATIQESGANVVVNCTAFHRVEACEKERDLAFFINGQIPRVMAHECLKTGAKIVHFSSDYVFEGRCDSPYVESDPVKPVNTYGESKLQGEIGIVMMKVPYLIFRVSGLFGSRYGTSSQKGGDFPRRLLESAKEDGKTLEATGDLWFSPTYVPYAAGTVVQMIEQGDTGLVHLVNHGITNWAQFGTDVLKIAGVTKVMRPTTQAEQEAKGLARRPRYSAMKSRRSLPWIAPPYQPMLEDYVRRLTGRE